MITQLPEMHDEKVVGEIKDNLNFYISHLDIRDLKILLATAKELVQRSQSYIDFLLKDPMD